jgi:hypothetical protein
LLPALYCLSTYMFMSHVPQTLPLPPTAFPK